MLKKIIVMLIFFSVLGLNNVQAKSATFTNEVNSMTISENKLLGKWVLNTYIGDKIFQDILELKIINNKAVGSLTVPKVFSSTLENIVVNNEQLTFEILVNEGSKPYRVKYKCHLHNSGSQIIGFADNQEDNSLIGGFVGIRTKEDK